MSGQVVFSKYYLIKAIRPWPKFRPTPSGVSQLLEVCPLLTGKNFHLVADCSACSNQRAPPSLIYFSYPMGRQYKNCGNSPYPLLIPSPYSNIQILQHCECSLLVDSSWNKDKINTEAKGFYLIFDLYIELKLKIQIYLLEGKFQVTLNSVDK